MKPVSDFLVRVQPYVLGCPEPTIMQAVVDAAIVFCEDTQVLRKRLDPIRTSVGVVEYDIDAPPHYQVARLLRLYAEGREVELVTREEAPVLDDWQSRPRVAYTSREGAALVLNLYPAPDAQYVLTMEVALRPVRGATVLDALLLEDYAEAIVAGAVSRLCAVPNQAFSSPALASDAGSAFAGLASKARRDGISGKVRAPMRVKPRPFI